MLGACGSDRHDSTAPAASIPSAPADLSFFADYSRYLWHRRRLVIATTNNGDEPVEVTSIALRTGYFDWLEREAKSTVIAPGARVDVQVDFGELVSCDDDPVGPVAVELALIEGSGKPATYVATVDPEPLDAIRDRECARRRVTDAADIAFGDDRTVDGDTMHTTIEVRRLDGGVPIRVDSLEGSVIIALEPVDDTEPVAVIEHDSTTIPVELFIARCEPHAVSQSTLTWVLSAFVSAGVAEPHKLSLELPEPMRAQLQAMIDECVARLAPNS